MQKRTQKLTVYVIVGLLIISLVGTSFMFLGDMRPTVGKNYQDQINSLKQALEANPQDTQTRLALADTYYDWGMQTLSQDMAEENLATTTSILQQAVTEYQEVLKTEKNVNILVDMATAAFYTSQNELADQTFQEALQEDPNFYNGLYNYGVFLYSQGDYGKAIEQWEKALALENISPDNKERLERNIKLAQDGIVQQFQQPENGDSSDANAEAK
ncbi:Tetratricopeptide TPR_2 repeat protein [Desulfitobacterium hafniense DCB-2]|uniref:Tetratricopeptide repeat protein n=2 Tax=Desulfitobacterium hafniense TaxID=49338 RepID=A0A098B9Y0_DESHA|nr:tetratricopeptide repeat protein [Desulfitobacterium hafniense]ACL22911.1 Tetratricopeptide TPR_2 repeat protein [Desulfitobacterium hafniense DCB-2]CDX05175.1 Tetratricopeptide repeat protein [Desulfitobacterium hafniense]